ncbi:MAG: uroporphyrinogen decarboxylase family protein [Planctomycetota bacterium]
MMSELSHRERVLLALQHKETDRVPIAMVCSGINQPAYAQFEALLRQQRSLSVAEYLAPLIDITPVGAEYVGPPLRPGQDMWGVHRASFTFGSGAYDEIDYHPLKQAGDASEIKKHRWPATDWFDYSVLPERIQALQSAGERCLMAANGNIFETSWYMRGFEQIFMDLALDPELVHAIFAPVTDFYCAHFARILSAAKGKIDLVFTADDIGGQNGLLMSLDMWTKHLKPYHTRLNKVIHEHGARVIYHSDGAVMAAVPGLLEMGIDILQALQFDCKGMDPAALKEQYGERLCFEGGVSVQSTLPFGTPEAVRQEVRERVRVLGRNGGYILGPSHAIQAGTPPENILALFDTAAGLKMGG